MSNTLSKILEKLATRTTWKDEQEATEVYEGIQKVAEWDVDEPEEGTEETDTKEDDKDATTDNKTPDNKAANTASSEKTSTKAGSK